MAVYEKDGLISVKDASGNTYLLYPITRLDCVAGAEDLLHYGAAQELTKDQMEQARENIGAAASTEVIPVPETAAVGQYLRIAAVDENGKVTAVEAATMSSSQAPTLDEDGVLVFNSDPSVTTDGVLTF